MNGVALLLCLLFSIPIEETFSKATCLRFEGKWAEASKFYAKLSRSEFEPLAEHSLYHLGECLAALGRDREAASNFEDYLKRYPKGIYYREALSKLTECYLNAGLYNEAVRRGFELLQRGINIQKALIVIGRGYEGLGNYNGAVLYYQRAMEHNPSTPLALSALERIEALRKRFKFRLSRRQIVLHGVVLYQAGKFREARAKLLKLRLKRGDQLSSKALYYIGLSYMDERRYRSAISILRKLAKLYPYPGYTTSAEYQIARCYRLRGKREEAKRRFLAFASKYPWSRLADNALYEAGKIQEERGRLSIAAKTFEKVALKYSKRNLADNALWRAGWCYFKARRYRDAIVVWRRLLKLHPGSSLANRTRFWIAKSYERMGMGYRALTYYKETAENGRFYYSIRAKEELMKKGIELKTFDLPPGAGLKKLNELPLTRAEILLKLGAVDDASKELTRALKRFPSLKLHIYYNLSLCSQRIGDYPASIRYGLHLMKMRGVYEEVMKLVYPFPFRRFVEQAARRFNLDPFFVAAMIYEESKFDPKAVSPAGAIGLMQIMPSTAQELAGKLGIKGIRRSMLFDPQLNITLGCYYLSLLFKRFDGNLYLAAGAYNSGPSKMREWVKRFSLKDIDEFVEDIPFPETKAHIKKTMSTFWIYRRLYSSS